MATTKATEPQELSFSELVPTRVARFSFDSIKKLDGKRVRITDVGQEGKVEKQGFYVVIEDGSKHGVPFTLARKIVSALKTAKEKGQAYVPANVKALDRGVRLS